MNPYLVHQQPTKRKERIYIKPKERQVTLHSKKVHTIHGNYSGYYGYRMQNRIDERLLLFKKEWFQGKKVLDVGCNSGHIILNIARLFGIDYGEGVDIDPQLIKKARLHLLAVRSQQYNDDLEYFPISSFDQFGYLPSDALNVHFRVGDFVHEPDPENNDDRFDIILGLSITKWIHLNNGDGGIRYFFNKVYKYLKKDGLFILEPQPFEGYKKRAGMAHHMRDNYIEMTFFPKDFVPFLTKKVGFTLIDTLEPPHPSKGFSRTVYILQK